MLMQSRTPTLMIPVKPQAYVNGARPVQFRAPCKAASPRQCWIRASSSGGVSWTHSAPVPCSSAPPVKPRAYINVKQKTYINVKPQAYANVEPQAYANAPCKAASLRQRWIHPNRYKIYKRWMDDPLETTMCNIMNQSHFQMCEGVVPPATYGVTSGPP